MHKPSRLTGQHVHFSLVDVFAHELLNGNPLALVVDAQELSQETMHPIAREFNQSETTFLLPPTRLLIGSLHWLIQRAHLLVSIGAIALVQAMTTRDARLKEAGSSTLPIQEAATPTKR